MPNPPPEPDAGAGRFRLRRAEPADAEAIRDLYCRSFTATFGHLYPKAELAGFLTDQHPGRFRENGPDEAIMLGEDLSGALCGFCAMGPYDLGIADSRRWWALKQLYLEESAKGQGLAAALMDWAIAEARLRGFQDLYLTVWIENHRARRLYERYGFVEVGKYEFRVGSTIDDDRIMRLSL